MADNELKGVDELMSRLKSLDQDIRYKGGRAALRRSAEVFQKNAKRRAQALDDITTGRSIAKNIAVRWDNRYFRRTLNLKFRVGVLKGAVLPKGNGNPDEGAQGPTPHWRLLQFGTQQMRAQPIFVPQESIQQAIDMFIPNFNRAIDRAIKRAKK